MKRNITIASLRGRAAFLIHSSLAGRIIIGASLAAVVAPVVAAPDWTRIETPSNWNYTLSQPSRSACLSTEGTIYRVGPTRPYLTPKDVPWLQLMPCDQVLIDYRAQPYRDVIFIASRGAPNKYITVRGLPGPNGERPIFDGTNATTSTNMGMHPVYDAAGMIIIGKPSQTAVPQMVYGYKPGYLHITGLRIQNARSTNQLTGLYQYAHPWPKFSAGISVNPAEHLAITNCELTNNGLGLFVNSMDNEQGQSRWLLISRNHFHNNGYAWDASTHNAYTEAVGTIYEYNYFGQPAVDTAGDNVKERSAGVIFRYNYLEGGVYGLSLRDPQSNAAYEGAQRDIQGELLTKNTFVYRNIFRMRGSSMITVGHGDGVYGDGRELRHGNLFFYNNKVVHDFDYRPWHGESVGLFQFLNTRETTTAVATNNVFYAKGATMGAEPAPFALIFWHGLANFQNNWINQFIHTDPNMGGHSGGVYIGTRYNGSGLNGMTEQTGTPGFTNLAGGNYTAITDAAYTNRTNNLPFGVTVRNLYPVGSPIQSPPVNDPNGN